MRDREQAIRAIFDREIAAANADYEPSGFIKWLENLRDEVVAVPVHVTDEMVQRAYDNYCETVTTTMPEAFRLALQAALNPE